MCSSSALLTHNILSQPHPITPPNESLLYQLNLLQTLLILFCCQGEMDTVGDLTSRRKSQENNALSTSLPLHSVSGNANSEGGGGPRRESRSWAGGSRIDDFFAAAMTKVTNLVRRGVKQGDRRESSLFDSQLITMNQQETPRSIELPHGGMKGSNGGGGASTADDTNKPNTGNCRCCFHV